MHSTAYLKVTKVRLARGASNAFQTFVISFKQIVLCVMDTKMWDATQEVQNFVVSGQ